MFFVRSNGLPKSIWHMITNKLFPQPVSPDTPIHASLLFLSLSFRYFTKWNTVYFSCG